MQHSEWQSLTSLAGDALRRILSDPESSAAVQLRAAQAVLRLKPPAPEEEVPAPSTIRYSTPPPGRNDRCPCGSGVKYKYCCLASGVALKPSG